MKLQLALVTTGIIACNIAGSAYASPISSRKAPHIHRRGLLDWGIGHYGGTVSELLAWPNSLRDPAPARVDIIESATLQASAKSEIGTASPTIMAMIAPTTDTETVTTEPVTTSTDGSTTWSTTTTIETQYVTRSPTTVTETPTEAPAKREELPLVHLAD